MHISIENMMKMNYVQNSYVSRSTFLLDSGAVLNHMYRVPKELFLVKQ